MSGKEPLVVGWSSKGFFSTRLSDGSLVGFISITFNDQLTGSKVGLCAVVILAQCSSSIFLVDSGCKEGFRCANDEA